MSAITYKLSNLADVSPDESDTRSWYVQLNAKGVVTVSCEAKDESTPESVRKHIDLRWYLSTPPDGLALQALLEGDTVRALLKRVHAGHKISGNTGSLTDAAEDALMDIDDLLSGGDAEDAPLVWTTDRWVAISPLDDLWPASQTLKQAVAALTEQAKADGIVLEGDLEESLLEKAEDAYEDEEDDEDQPVLKATHLAALRTLRRID